MTPPVQADLVGEHVQVIEWPGESRERLLGAGRVRAVTVTRDGDLWLWIEALASDPRPLWMAQAHAGDVYAVPTATGGGPVTIRIVRGSNA